MFVVPALFIGYILSFPILAIVYYFVFQEDLSNGFYPVPSLWASI